MSWCEIHKNMREMAPPLLTASGAAASSTRPLRSGRLHLLFLEFTGHLLGLGTGLALLGLPDSVVDLK